MPLIVKRHIRTKSLQGGYCLNLGSWLHWRITSWGILTALRAMEVSYDCAWCVVVRAFDPSPRCDAHASVGLPSCLPADRPALLLSSPPSVGRSNRPSVCTSARSAEAREPLGGFGAGRLPAAQRPHGRRGDIYIYIYMPTHARTRKPAHLCACEPLRSSLHA